MVLLARDVEGQQAEWQMGQGSGKAASQGNSGNEQMFPAYDQMSMQSVKDKDDVSGGWCEAFVKAMQHLNDSRRVDTKARKLALEKEEISKKWSEFPFVAQRQKFLNDSKQATSEMAELSKQKQETVKWIQELVLHKEDVVDRPPAALQPSADDINELMQTPMCGDMEVDQDEVLREALQAAHDTDAFLQVTVAEIASAEGPLTERVLQQKGPLPRRRGR